MTEATGEGADLSSWWASDPFAQPDPIADQLRRWRAELAAPPTNTPSTESRPTESRPAVTPPTVTHPAVNGYDVASGPENGSAGSTVNRHVAGDRIAFHHIADRFEGNRHTADHHFGDHDSLDRPGVDKPETDKPETEERSAEPRNGDHHNGVGAPEFMITGLVSPIPRVAPTDSGPGTHTRSSDPTDPRPLHDDSGPPSGRHARIVTEPDGATAPIPTATPIPTASPIPATAPIRRVAPTSAPIRPSTPPVTSPIPRIAKRGPATAPPAIEAKNLRKQFKDAVAVADVSFTVPTGSIVALLGPNGAGKTTTLNMLCTLIKPDGGTASVHGHDVVDDAPAVRRSIMLTGQFAALDESLTGRENLILFGKLLGLPKDAAKKRADELLRVFDLVEAGGKRVGRYSGGMRRRIDIACGLVIAPKVVFLDEPTTGLDPRSRLDVWALVERLRDSGVTILLTTQYLEEADMLSDSIVVIDKGRVIATGSSNDLKAATGASYCEVTPANTSELPRLHQILTDLLPREELQPGAVSVSVPASAGAQTLVSVIERTSAAGIELSDVSMRRPSLDEVFLALTDSDRGGPVPAEPAASR